MSTAGTTSCVRALTPSTTPPLPLFPGPRVQKALEGSLAELKVTEFPRVPTRGACGAYLALQAEVLALLELKRQLATRQALSAGTKRPAVKLEQGDEATPRADKRQRVARRFADD